MRYRRPPLWFRKPRPLCSGSPSTAEVGTRAEGPAVSRAERLDRYRQGLEGQHTGEAGPGKPLAESPEGGSESAPWYYRGNSDSRPEDLNEDAGDPTRAELRDFAQEHADDGYLATQAQEDCGRKPIYAHDPEIHLDGEGQARVRGLCQCEDAKVCATCAALKSREEGEELQLAIDLHRELGREVLMTTFTAPHHRGESLEELRELMATAYRKVKQGSPWFGAKTTTGMRDKIGYSGATKVVETTCGGNGWHPHIHALWFLEEPLEDHELQELRDWLTERWRKKVASEGGEEPHPEKGVQVHTGENSGRYMAKMGLGREASGLTHKIGQGANLTPFEMLAALWSHREKPVGERGKLEDRWQEYVRVMAGKQRIYSNGVVSEYLTGIRSARDPEITRDRSPGWSVRTVSGRVQYALGRSLKELESPEDRETERVATVEAEVWKRVVLPADRGQARLLEGAEDGGFNGVVEKLRAMYRELGLNPSLLQVDRDSRDLYDPREWRDVDRATRVRAA